MIIIFLHSQTDGTDKNVQEPVLLSNDEIKGKVRIVKAMNPDSLIWTELGSILTKLSMILKIIMN